MARNAFLVAFVVQLDDAVASWSSPPPPHTPGYPRPVDVGWSWSTPSLFPCTPPVPQSRPAFLSCPSPSQSPCPMTPDRAQQSSHARPALVFLSSTTPARTLAQAATTRGQSNRRCSLRPSTSVHALCQAPVLLPLTNNRAPLHRICPRRSLQISQIKGTVIHPRARILRIPLFHLRQASVHLHLSRLLPQVRQG